MIVDYQSDSGFAIGARQLQVCRKFTTKFRTFVSNQIKSNQIELFYSAPKS